jgi:hypothetical protein
MTTASATCCPIVELRQYTLKPDARDRLVRLFDEHFVEGQERLGMRIVGQFRDLSDPDRFVWLRGFADMETRRRALTGFYTGPVWKEHGPAANATMVDFDDVLLLRPTDERAAFPFDPRQRPSAGASEGARGLIVATIYHLTEADSDAATAAMAEKIEAGCKKARVALLARLTTEHAPNTYPSLPVREDARVLVWLARYESEADYRESMKRLGLEELSQGRAHQVLLLRPTPRSLLR